MPWVTVEVRVPRTFVPPEAAASAARLRELAAKFRERGDSLRSISSALDDSWEGVSHDTFGLDFSPRPGQLDSTAQWLEASAGELERTEVTVWETEEQPVWVD